MHFTSVRKLGLALPDAEESTMYGAPALKVRGHMFVCMASHKSAEPYTLVALGLGPTSGKGRAEGVPTWSLVSAFAKLDGSFVIIYGAGALRM